jgi:AcrR family transcriptional regulator
MISGEAKWQGQRWTKRMVEGIAWAPETDTHTKLILAGEALLGRHGIDAVPLHDIVAAAGQRNVSALTYHIGGREELLAAIVDRRRSAVDGRRVELLDAYAAAGIVMDETAIAAAVILPLAELMLKDPNGGNYLLLLSQLFVTDRPQVSYAASGPLDQGLRRCRRLYRARHPAVAPRLLHERFGTCAKCVIYALGDWERDKAAPRSYARSGLATFASELIAMTANSLCGVSVGDPRFKPFAAIHPAPHHEYREHAG